MTPRTTLALMALLGAGAMVQAETVMKIVYPGGNEVNRALTNTTEITFGPKSMDFFVTAGGSSERFYVSDDTEVTFLLENASVSGIAAEATSYRVLRNPVGTLLEIEGFTPGEPARLEVFALHGGRVLSLNNWEGNAVEVGFLAPGVYILKINNQTIKFIKS